MEIEFGTSDLTDQISIQYKLIFENYFKFNFQNLLKSIFEIYDWKLFSNLCLKMISEIYL